MTQGVIGKVVNGGRAAVSLPFYEGEAGVRMVGDRVELAIYHPANPLSAQTAGEGSFNSVAIRIERVERSRANREILLVTCGISPKP